MTHDTTETDIALIGYAARFPGAPDADALWNLLREASCTAVRSSREDLLASGVAPDLLEHPDYVPVDHPFPGDPGAFDADFFGISSQEAEIIDPQQRVLLELAHAGLEHAGLAPGAAPLPVGVFVGVGLNTYLLENLAGRYRRSSSVDHYHLMITNDKDYVATRIAYRLNLTGPAIAVNSACSTSLVAVHQACTSLLDAQCDVALAGAAHLRARQKSGYLYQEGMIFSPDGICRPFDAAANGTILGDGAAVVVLKRLADAAADGDTIHAVIKGSAVNNDGARKVGYTAPSAEGQAAVITEAIEVAGVAPATIGHIETHGTGTLLGDPIEIAGLTAAIGQSLPAGGGCALGAVKSNLGHLDVAAGMAGLIKTALMLEHHTLVPTLHFTIPNPELNLDATPFTVQTETAHWPTLDGVPRRAGVSAFGIGGTNAHLVLEEAPTAPAGEPGTEGPELVVVSAASTAALEASTAALARVLRKSKALSLADVAQTQAEGRRALRHRVAAVARDAKAAAMTLALRDPALTAEGRVDTPPRVVLRLAAGLDTPRDCRELLARAPAFADAVAQVEAAAGIAITPLLAAGVLDTAALSEEVAGCVGFALAYAEGRLWAAWLDTEPGYDGDPALVAAVSGTASLTQALAQSMRQGETKLVVDETVLAPLEGATNELERVLGLAGTLWVRGTELDWRALDGARPRRRIPLPTYPFQRQRYWVAPETESTAPVRTLLDTLRESEPGARKQCLVAHLTDKIGSILSDGVPAPGPNDPMLGSGALDSLSLVEIVAGLGVELRASIGASALIEHPTIDAFANHALAAAGLAAAEASRLDTNETARRDRRGALAARRRQHRDLTE